MNERRKPGQVRDAILAVFEELGGSADVTHIRDGVRQRLGPVPESSIRSYLRLNVGELFEREARGVYRLVSRP